jgi:hypothetical protein
VSWEVFRGRRRRRKRRSPEFERFETLLRELLAVPKAELDEARARERALAASGEQSGEEIVRDVREERIGRVMGEREEQ